MTPDLHPVQVPASEFPPVECPSGAEPLFIVALWADETGLAARYVQREKLDIDHAALKRSLDQLQDVIGAAFVRSVRGPH